MRGQWQSAKDPLRPQRAKRDSQNRLIMEPSTSGLPTCWKWNEVSELMQLALKSMDQSLTSRRALIMTNPGLQRGSTHTLSAAYQVVAPGEVAWAHKHSINALRVGIKGDKNVFTVVDGQALPMEPYDIVLTPGGQWHEHHNNTDKPACWLDCLDVPFTLALNQSFYEDLGDATQERSNIDPISTLTLRPDGLNGNNIQNIRRYPWLATWDRLQEMGSRNLSPVDGVVLRLVNPITQNSVLPSIDVSVHLLPPGFQGKVVRRSSSSVNFIVKGEGAAVFEDTEIAWQAHDTYVIPNWTWVRICNRSKTDPAVYYTLSDSPILQKFDFYREEFEK